MYYFYVLYSLKDHRLYKGSSSDIGSRFIKHSAGGSPSTQHRRPLVLIYVESHMDKQSALNRERWSKSPEGGPVLKQMLIEKGILDDDGGLRMDKNAHSRLERPPGTGP